MAALTEPDPIDWINLRAVVLDSLEQYGCGHCYATLEDQAEVVANAIYIQLLEIQPPNPIEVEEFRASQ